MKDGINVHAYTLHFENYFLGRQNQQTLLQYHIMIKAHNLRL